MPQAQVRQRAAQILQGTKPQDTARVWFDVFLITLILANVAAVIMASVEPFERQYRRELHIFEVFSVLMFTIEYIARVWACVDHDETDRAPWRVRLHYIVSPMAIIDLLAILPFYLGLFINLDLRFLRVVRLLRLAKLTRYSSAMQVLFDVFRREYRVLLASLVLLLILMVVASSGIYLIERTIQPENFGSIPKAMWWAMATLTTVGYGDVTPVTPLGRFFAGTITVISMAMVALPAGILASSFSEQIRKRRDTFRARVKAALEDGAINSEELMELESLRRSLGMDKKEAENLFRLIESKQKPHVSHVCPHCGKNIRQTPP